MQDFIQRFFYLIANTLAVLFLMVLVDKEFVMPIIGIWILTELGMVQKRMQEWEQPQESDKIE